MTVLEKTARNQLDKAVQAARRAATVGADRALRSLSVDQEKKPAHLSPEQSELRRQLRGEDGEDPNRTDLVQE